MVPPSLPSTHFSINFREVFEHPAEGRGAGEQLLALSQGRRTAADYALSFRTLAAQTTWVEVYPEAAVSERIEHRTTI